MIDESVRKPDTEQFALSANPPANAD